MKKFALAVTGGIAGGKSTFCTYLAKNYKIPWINYDAINHQLLEPGQPGFLKMLNYFGAKNVLRHNTLNKAFIRNQILRNTRIKNDIENQLHPLIRQNAKRAFLHFLQTSHAPYCTMEIPLLGNDNITPYFVKHVAIILSNGQFQRLKKRNTETYHSTLKKMIEQQSMTSKRLKNLKALPHSIVQNNGTTKCFFENADVVHRDVLKQSLNCL